MADNRCDFCGKSELLPFNCRYCGGVYCASHRLPEYHECPGLRTLKENRTVLPSGARKPAVPKKRSGVRLPRIRLPARGYYAYILIGLTIFTFLFTYRPYEVFPGLSGALSGALILGGSSLLTAPWTLLTYMFLHGGVMHLFFNLLTLFFFGPLLERQIGSVKFLGVYFGSGLLAGLAQVLLFPASLVLGASGAIFGIMGALTVLMPDLRIYLYFVPMKIVYAVILFAAIDLILLPTGDGIAHGAHLVGLFAGLLFGYLLKKGRGPLQAYWHT